ncbi:MAG: CAP domain-containing protein [Candidatus Limnocylindrales bacterium]
MPGLGKMTSSAAPGPTRRLRIGVAALGLAILTIVATASPAFGWDPSAFSPADEQLLFTLTNQDRVSAGLNPLVNDSFLHKMAEWRAKDMGDRDYFSHTIPPDNHMVFYYMQRDGYCFKVAGENIGLSTYGDDIATSRIEAAFMGSTSHRENILGTWQRMGVGAYKAADGRKLYVVLFSLPCTTAKPKPKATAKPVARATPVTTKTAAPTATPTVVATDTPTPTEANATPTLAPSASPTAPPSSAPTYDPATGGQPSPTEQTALSLRVRDEAPSQGPLDSLFRMLFGGLLG